MKMLSQTKRCGRDRRGAAAVEFAFVAPCLLLLIFGAAVFGSVLTIYHGVQQLAAEAARASVAGLSDSECDQLARSFVAGNAAVYAFLDPTRLTVSTASQGNAFRVAVSYDLSSSFIFGFARLLPMPPPAVTRSAVVQRGGFRT